MTQRSGRRTGKDGKNPVRRILAQLVRFECGALPCIHVEFRWSKPQPNPAFAGWTAVDEKGKAVNLTAAQRAAVQGTLLDPNSPFKFDPPQRVAAMPCIGPCTCGNEKAQPWVQGPQSFAIDASLTVAFPGSTADKVTVTVSWQADRFRVVVGKCQEEA